MYSVKIRYAYTFDVGDKKLTEVTLLSTDE